MSKKNPPSAPPTDIIGWRQWLSLPELGVDHIKAKIDTGAKTSSIHAFDLKITSKGKHDVVSFTLHPHQKSKKDEIRVKAVVLEYRKVKSSNGHVQKRPVILTKAQLLGHEWDIEVTLTNRDEMGFRMLLGRDSIKGRFLIDCSQSFVQQDRERASGGQ